MSDVQPRRLANGQIDYGHYRGRARRLRMRSLRRAGQRCARLVRVPIGAIATAIVRSAAAYGRAIALLLARGATNSSI